MQCPSCGHQNRPDARFCDKCGARLSQKDQAGAPQSQLGTQSPGPAGPGWQSPTTVNQLLPSSSPPKRVTSPTSVNPPTQSRRPGALAGTARNVQLRSEPPGTGSYGATQVLTFRLEQYDSSGNRIKTLPVEMRGFSITGFINDGDEVEVFGKLEDGLIRTKQVQNRATGATVQVKEPSKTAGITCLILIGLLMFTIVALVLYFGFISHP